MHPHADRTPNFPTLEPGVTLLDRDSQLGVEPLQALVLDHLLTTDGVASWVDAGGRARTSTLRELAPHRRYLNRIDVARGFTPYQHASLVDRLAGRIESSSVPHTLVVTPALDALYRDTDIARREATEQLLHALAILSEIAREHDIPVLVTRTRTDEFAEPIAAAATARISCEATRFGPRFSADSAETLVYPITDGWVQTTLTFWQEILEHRARIDDTAATPTPMASVPGW
ncbi:hypothetical protein [Halorubrum trueperi]|uniref:DNA recombination and repair protein Rad51-like C-terminal domain-containing protein n=1 Tax=Halorubrum trueperi TaxID=2004704 RepID=A0ABD5UL40_9EURY